MVHWPKGLRHQFHHVIDVAATILEAGQLPEPYVNSLAQMPMQGVSMLYSLDDAKASERREMQVLRDAG